ncbi:MAG: 50S ribosomal protein L6 [Candidatus Dadabacteria bacterium]|nr:MAG: 50S ribosomal protein L6 [Candidatus Dadabacteria bacterium]
MSRVGMKPIEVPQGVSVEVKESGVNRLTVSVKGPKGSITKEFRGAISVVKDGSQIVVQPKAVVGQEKKSRREIAASLDKQTRAMWGTVRAQVANMIKGVVDGWKKALEINGIGYSAQVSGKEIKLLLGYSHPVVLKIPDGINCKVNKNIVEVEGVDKEAVGQLAAKIRWSRPPDPYLAKGVKYVGETIIRKAGKAAK